MIKKNILVFSALALLVFVKGQPASCTESDQVYNEYCKSVKDRAVNDLAKNSIFLLEGANTSKQYHERVIFRLNSKDYASEILVNERTFPELNSIFIDLQNSLGITKDTDKLPLMIAFGEGQGDASAHHFFRNQDPDSYSISIPSSFLKGSCDLKIKFVLGQELGQYLFLKKNIQETKKDIKAKMKWEKFLKISDRFYSSWERISIAIYSLWLGAFVGDLTKNGSISLALDRGNIFLLPLGLTSFFANIYFLFQSAQFDKFKIVQAEKERKKILYSDRVGLFLCGDLAVAKEYLTQMENIDVKIISKIADQYQATIDRLHFLKENAPQVTQDEVNRQSQFYMKRAMAIENRINDELRRIELGDFDEAKASPPLKQRLDNLDKFTAEDGYF